MDSLDAYVQRIVDAAPPLTQRRKIDSRYC
jgi:hypothetical protein